MSIKGDHRRWVVLDPDRNYGGDVEGEWVNRAVKEYCEANHGGAKAVIGTIELKRFAAYLSQLVTGSKK